MSINPNYANGHSNLGSALWGLRRLEEAATSYRAALAVEPEMAEAAGSLGSVLLAMGKTKEGLEMEDKGFGVIHLDSEKGITINHGNAE